MSETKYTHPIAGEVLEMSRQARDSYLDALQALSQAAVEDDVRADAVLRRACDLAVAEWEADVVYQVRTAYAPTDVDLNLYAEHVFRRCLDLVTGSRPQSTWPLAGPLYDWKRERAARIVRSMASGMDPAYVALLLDVGY